MDRTISDSLVRLRSASLNRRKKANEKNAEKKLFINKSVAKATDILSYQVEANEELWLIQWKYNEELHFS